MMRLLPHAIPLIFGNRLTELTMFITTACNMRCRHCFVIDELNKKTDLLTVDEVRRMGRHIPFMQRVHISGGEPFTRKDLAEVVLSISNEWNAGVVCVPNNGWYTDNVVRTIERFGTEGKGHLRIHFSLHSTNAQAMDNFTQRPGSFERWMETVAAASEAKRRFRNVTLIALSTYNMSNMDTFPELVDFVLNDTGVDEFSFHLARSHDGYENVVDTTNYKRVLDDYFRNKYRGHPVLRAYRELVRREHLRIIEENTPLPCRAATLRVVVAPNADVYPCERMGYPNGTDRERWLLGNLRENDYDLPALLRQPHVEELRREIASTPCGCNHEIDTSLSLLSRNSFRFKVLRRALDYYIDDRRRGRVVSARRGP